MGLSGSVSRLLSWLLMTMVKRIHHGVTSVDRSTARYLYNSRVRVSGAVSWVLWAWRGSDIHRHLQSCKKPWALLLRDAQAFRPYARSNSGQARMCCRQVALDAEGACLHVRRKDRASCDGGNSKMDLLCKTSDAARAGLQDGGQARPDRTRRDAMGPREPIGHKCCHTVQHSMVESDSGSLAVWQPQNLAGEEGSEGKRQNKARAGSRVRALRVEDVEDAASAVRCLRLLLVAAAHR